MKNTLWKFIDEKGTFVSKCADQINSLYLPLCNDAPFMSSITSNLHGDIKTGDNSFLLEPVSRIDLSNSKISRNFWLYINPGRTWSVTGVSKDCLFKKDDSFSLKAGLLWQEITRQNKKIGLRAKITSFVPSTGESLEIMAVELTNISTKAVKFIPTAAIPIYARPSGNLRDHRHVTSLLNRAELNKHGVIVTPTLVFDETGHKKNDISYFVFATGRGSEAPEYIFPAQEQFCGDCSDLEAPEAVLKNLKPDKDYDYQGKEAMAGLKFKAKTLGPKQSCSYIVIMGITKDKRGIEKLFRKFDSPAKVQSSLETTIKHWQNASSKISLNTPDKDFNNWFRWVSIQPLLRKIYGCSFLPDFDYGKGGRGWRDLWQDCLSLILINPEEARQLLINNFKGIRIDGSNATIIGSGPGQFISDRNNISRVWMDHGIWPLITALFYIHQSSDIKIILEKTEYFRDHQLSRGTERDLKWNPSYGKQLKTKTGEIYRGSILEHLLVETLVQFFNVGPHNLIRLENADWNDGLDMAAEFGESVAFSSMYAQNLNSLCELIRKSGIKEISLFREINILLDSLSANRIDYSRAKVKRMVLSSYFDSVKYEISGKRLLFPAEKIISDLKKKAGWLSNHIRNSEWLKEGFFNGYYGNDKQRVEGKINGCIRMTLTGQALPIMSGVANEKQIDIILRSINKYLKDKTLKGISLNTDFGGENLNMGRAFSFIYGDKENGAFFNHMSVLLVYGLYKRGFVKEASECLDSIYRMCLNSEKSKIYPCLPEYFNSSGRGMYSYLTGSASWFILTLLTQAFGVRGEYGDLILEPKLTISQFKHNKEVSINTFFAKKPLQVIYRNVNGKDFGKYSISKISFNGKLLSDGEKVNRYRISRFEFLRLATNNPNIIEVELI